MVPVALRLHSRGRAPPTRSRCSLLLALLGASPARFPGGESHDGDARHGRSARCRSRRRRRCLPSTRTAIPPPARSVFTSKGCGACHTAERRRRDRDDRAEPRRDRSRSSRLARRPRRRTARARCRRSRASSRRSRSPTSPPTSSRRPAADRAPGRLPARRRGRRDRPRPHADLGGRRPAPAHAARRSPARARRACA